MGPFVIANGEVLVPCPAKIMPINSLTRWRGLGGESQ
jgi:hypothetical protein